MSDSWDSFAEVLTEETRAMSHLHAAALELTNALVTAGPNEIRQVTENVEKCRRDHARHAVARRSMQRRGFGKMSLREVGNYAPRQFHTLFQTRLYELHYFAASLRITNDNNKALVVAGMDRLLKIVDVLQRAASEQTGTYRRRGLKPKKDASVIVSQRA
jgi:hypothetical protein